jgi:diguanylate cyclase (GGDEF)-like protein
MAIQSGLRASDFAGRFGGEEFLILLPETTVHGAWQVAEQIRRSVAATSVPGVDRDITASLGIAGLLEHGGDATGLLREADRAQYAAKAAGRNRTVVAAVAPDAEPPFDPVLDQAVEPVPAGAVRRLS